MVPAKTVALAEEALTLSFRAMKQQGRETRVAQVLTEPVAWAAVVAVLVDRVQMAAPAAQPALVCRHQ